MFIIAADNGQAPQALLAHRTRHPFGIGTTTVAVPESTPVLIPMGTTSVYSDLVVGVNSLTIVEPGDYRIEYSLVVAPTLGPQTLDIGIYVDGVLIPASQQQYVLSVDTQTHIYGYATVSLNTGDVIDFEVSSLAAFFLVLAPGVNASLSAMQL